MRELLRKLIHTPCPSLEALAILNLLSEERFRILHCGSKDTNYSGEAVWKQSLRNVVAESDKDLPRKLHSVFTYYSGSTVIKEILEISGRIPSRTERVASIATL